MPDGGPNDRVLHKLLTRQAARYGDRTYLYFKEREYGFTAIDRMSDRVAGGLQHLGIHKGDKVAIILDNCPEFIFLIFGLSKLGIVQVPIVTAHRGELLTYMLGQSGSRLLVVQARYLPFVLEVLGNLPGVDTLVVLEDQDAGSIDLNQALKQISQLGKRFVLWSQLTDNDGTYQPAEVTWSDVYAILYTSGTTGPSKGSVTPHNHPIRSAEVITRTAGYRESDRIYTATPLFHASAQFFSMVSALLCGAQVVLLERFSASSFWDTVRHYGCTVAAAPGSMVGILHKAEPRPDDHDNPLRVMVGGGAPAEIILAFEQRFGVTRVEFYGTSEANLVLAQTLEDRRPGSCGRPFPDYAVKVVDDSGCAVGPGVPGELLVRPRDPYCMQLGYYKMPEQTVEAWRDLWFHTGDCLYYDDEGYFYFVDRKKDAIRRRGENISSFELEKIVNSHPAVLESAAIAVKSDVGDDEVQICVVLKPGQTLAPDELIDFCSARMAYFMVPRYVRFMSALPKTAAMGRVAKHELRRVGITPDTWDRGEVRRPPSSVNS